MDWSQKALLPYEELKHPGLCVMDFRAAGLFLSNVNGFQASSHIIHFCCSVFDVQTGIIGLGRTSCLPPTLKKSGEETSSTKTNFCFRGKK